MNSGKRSQASRDLHFFVVGTAWGPALLVWSETGVARFELPDPTGAAITARGEAIAKPGKPSGFAAEAVRRIRAYFDGHAVELDGLPLDLGAAAPFARRVYEETRRVARGQVSTYGEIAERIGSPGAARSVGGALAHNPIGLIVPCHRILAAGGKVGGFSAAGGVPLKRRMLALEGAPAVPKRRSPRRPLLRIL